jgi:hypothetical protein
MAQVVAARTSARIDGPFVVFLIGFRINRLWAFHKWVPVAKAMGPMIRELMANPESGFLHAETMLTWRGVAMLQYWRSFEQLHAYAHDRNATHLPAWAAFNRSVGTDGSVGIWHETYQVAANQYECVYANMPRFGLARAGAPMDATGRRKDARSRMGAGPEDASG